MGRPCSDGRHPRDSDPQLRFWGERAFRAYALGLFASGDTDDAEAILTRMPEINGPLEKRFGRHVNCYALGSYRSLRTSAHALFRNLFGFREVEVLGGAYLRFRREIRVYQLALCHPRTPRMARWLLRAAIAYCLSPIDLIPDFIPVVGHLDDAVIVSALVVLALRLIPREVIDECREGAAVSDRATSIL